jgi:transposase
VTNSKFDPCAARSYVGPPQTWASERAFKPVALGRKNWLFAGSDQGGETAAVLMSLCTTCKNLGIDPQAYLRDVLDRISTHPARRIEELLPDRWQELHQAAAATD